MIEPTITCPKCKEEIKLWSYYVRVLSMEKPNILIC